MRNVLIVDDDPFIRRLIAATLEDVGDYVLVQASTGDEAVEVALRERPVIVFIDLDMPGIDGVEACRRLRALPEAAAAMIVMLTGSARGTDQQRAIEAGVDLFLTKPFSPLELLRIVERLHPAADGGANGR